MVRSFFLALFYFYKMPTTELPSTAWPCRLRHVPEQSIPSLTFNPEPFKKGLAKLREHGFGSKMQAYQPPADDPFADILDENAPDPTPSEDLARIHYKWKDLSKQTRENLLLFERLDFDLRSCAKGSDDVAQLVSSLYHYAKCSDLICNN
jgi:hypothetical protein